MYVSVFPYPYNEASMAHTTFMSIPIETQDGYVLLGIFGSILFIIAMILLLRSINKYHFRTFVIVVLLYSFYLICLSWRIKKPLLVALWPFHTKGMENVGLIWWKRLNEWGMYHCLT